MDDLIMLLIVLGTVAVACAIAAAVGWWVSRNSYETPEQAARRRDRNAPPDTMPTSFD